MTVYLDVDGVVELHAVAGEPVPLIDRATLEAAVARCQAGFGGEDAFPRLVDKAAALLHGIASTQCFQDGNKRAAWLSTVVFLELNGYQLPDIPDIEAEVFVMAVAVSAWTDRTVEKAAEWLEVRSGAGRVSTHHPQLDFACIAIGATVDDHGTYNVLRGGMASVVTAGPSIPMKLDLLCRVTWTPADEGRPHTITATVLDESGDEPLWQSGWTWGPPVRGGHAHHPHHLMPSVAALALLLMPEQPGPHRVRVHLDDVLLTELPLNVVFAGELLG